MTKQLFAKYVDCNSGYDHERQTAIDNLKLGEVYEVDHISMGQSHTTVYLKGFDRKNFGSVSFEFYDAVGKEQNIFEDPEFNPYMGLN